MADPFAILALAGPWGSAAAAAPAHRWSLRADRADAPRLAAAWGAPLPPMLRAAPGKGRAALSLGLDEWLLLADRADAAAALAALAPDPPFSLVDITHRQCALDVAGTGAATLIAAGCPLDLANLPEGTATRTVLGKAEIVLWRRAAHRWHLEAWRSFAPYVAAFLTQAAADQ